MSTSSRSTPDADGPGRLESGDGLEGLDAVDALDGALKDALHRVWGFSEFRPLQREAMHAILASRDSVLVLPTGGGKSVCFQAPAVVQDHGVGVVISPLISLMKDQVDGLRADGVAASYLNSTQTPEERDAVVASLRTDRCRLLYVSPERIVGDGGPALRRLLQQSGVRFIAVDEAHCISQWGHDFRPEYRQLGRLRDDFPGVSLHAFTATATERVRADIAHELRLNEPAVLVGSFDRPNLTYRVLRRGNLHAQLRAIFERHEGDAGIVYCLSRREVESLAAWLLGEGHRAVPYHAGLPDAVRSGNQEAFLQERADIVVATVAFGMGIDRSNVRFVVHAGAPRSAEHYQQESGRAGRDGLPAECVLIYSGADFVRWRQMLEASGELTTSGRALLADMQRYAGGTRCRHRTLVEYFGQTYARASCGACDWCLRELDVVADSTIVARKILSSVARLKQGWGTGHVTDVLLGRATEKVTACRHDALSTFGLLEDESAPAVRGYIEQLVAEGFLAREGDPYPVLRVTPPGVSLLRGQSDCTLYREVRPPVQKRRRGASAAGGPPVPADVDRDLFDLLRDLRLRLARERGVPPYVIFHDTTLRDMVQRRPKTIDDLHEVYGVGARKAADFGDAFLDAIRTFHRPE
jgi:ATP-dependent DNA helicase RecQ